MTISVILQAKNQGRKLLQVCDAKNNNNKKIHSRNSGKTNQYMEFWNNSFFPFQNRKEYVPSFVEISNI